MANLRIQPRLLLKFNGYTFPRLLTSDATQRQVSEHLTKRSANFTANDINMKVHMSKNKILTVPNFLTASRLAIAPAMGYFIWNGMNTPAVTCFAVAAFTDLIDGWIARRFNQNSDLGAILDPIADKVLLTTCFITMYNVDMLPLWVVEAFVGKDLILLLGGAYIRHTCFLEKPTLKKFLDIKRYPTIGFEPTLTSKCNTALQCLLVATHLTTNHMAGDFFYDWGMFGFHLTTFGFTVVSLSQYVTRFLYKEDTRVPKFRN